MSHPEVKAVIERYARRNYKGSEGPGPEVQQMLDERRRGVLRLFRERGWNDLSAHYALELGCGRGDNLAQLISMGFSPQRLTGIELLVERFEAARKRLPDICLIPGDASEAEIDAFSQDFVLQFMVFSSLLDDDFQQLLASAMWRWLRPGGAIVWYDFTFNNPYNPDVRGVPLSRVRALFPGGRVTTRRRITLAPPLARAICRVHPNLYGIFNSFPLLRTHLLAWIEKPSQL